jgi:hypothetical protein
MNLIDQHARSQHLPSPTGNADVQEWLKGNKLRDKDFALENGLIHGVAPYAVRDGGVFVAVPS